jgi:replicative DNA helicase
MADTVSDSAAEAVRRPPQSIASEQSILGGLMIDNKALDSVLDIVQPEDFAQRSHRLIYEQIVAMIQKGNPADVLTVDEALRNAGTEAEAGGLAYLNELVNNTPSAANIRRYAEIVHDKSVLRQLISVGDKMVTAALSPEGRDTAQILEDAERDVLAINERNSRGKRGFQPMGSLVRNVSERIVSIYNDQQGSDVTGVPSGYPNLDRELAGLQRGDLIVIAGRPSMGKTALALNIAENVGVRLGLPVAIFSLEMGAEQLAQRLISSVANIDAQKLRKARLEDEEWGNFTKALKLLEDKPIYIDDTPGLLASEIGSRARRLSNQTGQLGLIVVDYIQLIPGRSNSENRSTELSEISRSLKALAKELNCPVIVLSQLNRSVENRPDKRPIMADLRESGAIEQDADVIMFIYRDVVYNKETPDKNLAEIIIGKQRNGPIGTLRMVFRGGNTRFEPWAGDTGYWDGVADNEG